METPPIILTRLPDSNQRRMSCTSQMFTRIDKHTTSSRELKTSKLPRAFPNSVSKQSLSDTKQNLKFYDYIKKIKSSVKIDESKIASNYLLSLRKQYDKMSKVIKNQSDQINSMRRDIQLMRGRVKNQEGFFTCSHEKVQDLKAELEEFSHRQEEARMQTKILDHIINRMKQDQLQRKTLCQTQQQRLKQRKKHLKQKQQQVLQWDESIHKILEQMERIREQFKKNSQKRENKLQDYKIQIQQLSQHEKFEQDRKERTFQLLSMESNDILDAKNVVLRDVMMTNKVLDKLLQGKINQLLNRYQGLQNCYHLIKTQTNISDPQVLAKKFFSYAQNLEQITSTIRSYEKRQQQLTERNKELKQIQKQKLIKKLEEDKLFINNEDQNKEEKQYLIQQSLEKQLAIKKIRSWLDKLCEGLGVKKGMDCGPAEQIKIICQYAINKASEVKQMSKTAGKFQTPGIRLKKVVKQFSEQDDKIRRSEAQEVSETNLLQSIYLSYERKQVKKNHFQIKTQAKVAKQ